MKHLSILFHEKHSDLSTISCVVGAYEVISAANAFRRRSGKENLFSVQVVGTSKKTEVFDGLFTVKPHAHISSVGKSDLVIIPSLARSNEINENDNVVVIDWIKKQHKRGAALASMCSGAFLLAATGLLNNKDCSTHFSHATAFRQLFPEVNLLPDQLITDESGIYTNGGAYSFLNLMIYLVERYYDRATAIYCSKIFQIEIDRNSQSTFAIFTGQKLHGDEIVREAQTYIEKNATEKISVGKLSSRLAVGRRNFDRRFIKATGNTPAEYLQRVKIETARKMLETSGKTVSEVMYKVGYTDPKAFREKFRKITGVTPREYRKKYNKRETA